MSTDRHEPPVDGAAGSLGDGLGGKGIAEDLVAQSVAMVREAARREGVADGAQLDLLAPIDPEELAEAREALGPNAGGLSVLRKARENRRGRPVGSRNRRSDDFAKWIGGFGQDPAITLMQIQSTPEEVLIERSRRTIIKVTDKGRKVEVETAMTWEAAQAARIRCAEALMPYVHSKRPVAVDMTFTGVADLIIEGVTHSSEELADIIEAEFTSLPLPGEDFDGEDGA